MLSGKFIYNIFITLHVKLLSIYQIISLKSTLLVTINHTQLGLFNEIITLVFPKPLYISSLCQKNIPWSQHEQLFSATYMFHLQPKIEFVSCIFFQAPRFSSVKSRTPYMFFQTHLFTYKSSQEIVFSSSSFFSNYLVLYCYPYSNIYKPLFSYFLSNNRAFYTTQI